MTSIALTDMMLFLIYASGGVLSIVRLFRVSPCFLILDTYTIDNRFLSSLPK